MGKTDLVEEPINAKKLAEIIYKLQYPTKTSNLPELKEHVSVCEDALMKNVVGGSIDEFLHELEAIFIDPENMQAQMLFIEFIENALSNDELDAFITLMSNAPSGIISPVRQAVILRELKK
jgi:hypothetical protein